MDKRKKIFMLMIGREGERERGREGERERGREGERKRGREGENHIILLFSVIHSIVKGAFVT